MQQVDYPGGDGQFFGGPPYRLESPSETTARLDAGSFGSILIHTPPGLVSHLSIAAASTTAVYSSLAVFYHIEARWTDNGGERWK